jgi:hypothetical protein
MGPTRGGMIRVSFKKLTPGHTQPGEVVMGLVIDEIITLLALGDTRHRKE